MVGIPVALAIALWLVLSVWAVALVSNIFGFPSDIVWLTLLMGVAAGYMERVLRRRPK
jgi:hypothetical protein